jgi:hypothetical protein
VLHDLNSLCSEDPNDDQLASVGPEGARRFGCVMSGRYEKEVPKHLSLSVTPGRD